MPWNVGCRGHEIPLTAVLGAIGTFGAWCAVVALHGEARTIGIPWMVLGMVGYFVYRRRQGLDPRKLLQDRARRSAHRTSRVFDYRSALVPIFGADVSASVLHSAAKLIGQEGVVYAIFVLPVPSQLSLDAGLEQEEAHGRSVLESARIQARRAGIKIHTGLIRTRHPGRIAGRGSRAGGRRRDLLVDHPRARGRAAHRPDRRLPAQPPPVSRDHRDRQPRCGRSLRGSRPSRRRGRVSASRAAARAAL